MEDFIAKVELAELQPMAAAMAVHLLLVMMLHLTRVEEVEVEQVQMGPGQEVMAVPAL